MKKCASCTKDLPDAALHCVFCGAKQPPAPAVQQGLAKTAFGYSATDVAEQLRQQARPPVPPQVPAYNPPPYPPPRPAPPTSPPPMATPPPPRPPAPPYGAPQGGYVPPSPANAATLFAPTGPPQAATVQVPGPGSSYPRPNPPPAMLPPTLVPPPPPLQGPPIMHIPAAQPPPYLASQTASRAGWPADPWKQSLRLMMVLAGVALLAAFVTPLRIRPELMFHWKLILEGEGTARLPPLMLAAVGMLSVIVAAIPMPSGARGAIAAILGLSGVVVPIALTGVPPWQGLLSMIGMLVLVPSLLVRDEYRSAAVPRLLVTLGALGILLPFLLPQSGAIPLVNIFKSLIDQPGAAKVDPALALALITIVVMSLLAWLPAPVTGAAKVWAWLLILWALIVHATLLVVGGNLGDAVSTAPNEIIVSWVAGGPGGIAIGSAYLALVGYGLASVVGKQLE